MELPTPRGLLEHCLAGAAFRHGELGQPRSRWLPPDLLAASIAARLCDDTPPDQPGSRRVTFEPFRLPVDEFAWNVECHQPEWQRPGARRHVPGVALVWAGPPYGHGWLVSFTTVGGGVELIAIAPLDDDRLFDAETLALTYLFFCTPDEVATWISKVFAAVEPDLSKGSAEPVTVTTQGDRLAGEWTAKSVLLPAWTRHAPHVDGDGAWRPGSLTVSGHLCGGRRVIVEIAWIPGRWLRAWPSARDIQ